MSKLSSDEAQAATGEKVAIPSASQVTGSGAVLQVYGWFGIKFAITLGRPKRVWRTPLQKSGESDGYKYFIPQGRKI
ncbi:MAG TPA: hypothetical protein VN950_27570 [Terriglobales bacterium]|nr:hypothetical protein [Terriglobales bacterium]